MEQRIEFGLRMRAGMAYKIADNIISPLGGTTDSNLAAVKAGESALRLYSGKWGVPEEFTASLFSHQEWEILMEEGLTKFESLALRSIEVALGQVSEADGFDIASGRVVLILSSTKANVDCFPENQIPGEAAEKIARKIGLTTTPIVVCNACISGLHAIILAQRLLEGGAYDYAIVCGADVLSKFIVSGFQSLKATSAAPCRPFDIERNGLNLGEAAATIILSTKSTTALADSSSSVSAARWQISSGAIRNDAYHISTPERKGDGLVMALQAVAEGKDIDSLALINAHGTATMFNDPMEAAAVRISGLENVSLNALKGYFGHTMGACGVLETVLTMHALDEGLILGTRGFEELGVSTRLNISSRSQTTEKQSFIKTLSGFGGCNAAIWASKVAPTGVSPAGSTDATGKAAPTGVAPAGGTDATGKVGTGAVEVQFRTVHSVKITPSEVLRDGASIATRSSLTALYRQFVGDYPKYYKMDGLSRLGFIASEMLRRNEPAAASPDAVILFNRSSSIATDRAYYDTISAPENYFPSPSHFVYTLPNIVTGEIAIREQIHGETAFYILPDRDEAMMKTILEATAKDPRTGLILTGWLDYEDEENYIADLKIIDII